MSKRHFFTDISLLLRQQGRRIHGGWTPLTSSVLKGKYLLSKEFIATHFPNSYSKPPQCCHVSHQLSVATAVPQGLVLPLLPYRYNYNRATSDDNVSPEKSNKQHRRCVCKHTALHWSALVSRSSLSQRRTLSHRRVFGLIGGWRSWASLTLINHPHYLPGKPVWGEEFFLFWRLFFFFEQKVQ